MIRLFLFSLTVLFFCGCNVPPGPENSAKIQCLKTGMTRTEVISLLGEPHSGEGEFAKNPNIWYYYTQTVWSDGNITREECTPLCFDPNTGKLVGWGHEFRKKFVLYGDWRKQEWQQWKNPTFED